MLVVKKIMNIFTQKLRIFHKKKYILKKKLGKKIGNKQCKNFEKKILITL